MIIRPVSIEDASAISNIYAYYVENTIITFEEEIPSEAEFRNRIQSWLESKFWLVAEKDAQIVGYANAKQWKPRTAYRFCYESSIYLNHQFLKSGIITLLYTELFHQLKELDIRSVVAGIALPNNISINFHEKFGFQKVAHFKEQGFKFNTWIDVAYWQMFL